MPVTLAPTVHERLARCGERVYVDGLVAGASVELHVDSAIFSATATGGGHVFTVPPLAAGGSVRARQDDGSGFTPFSPEVVVEDAFVPPEAAPGLPEMVGSCSECVHVFHATPGALIELRIEGTVVGEAVAGRHGDACVGVDMARAKTEPGARLTARQVVCGAAGPDATRVLALLPSLSMPSIGSPIFGCQNRVPISEARAGARLSFETATGDHLGSVCTCWDRVDVYVTRPLAVGEQVRARCSYDSNVCEDVGPWSGWRMVEAPDERIKPEVREVLVEGDQVIRLGGQIPGAMLVVRIAPTEGAPPVEFGPRPTSEEQEIALNALLVAGNEVSAVQTLCGVSVESDKVIVQPPPPVILAPVLVPPLHACAGAVQVSNLHPGALVRVYADGIGVGTAWAGLETSIAVPVAPALAAGRKITAFQWVGGTRSPESNAVQVTEVRELSRPRILEPVALGDGYVWVSGVTPGARVSILSGGTAVVIGEADAAEPVVRVPIDTLVGPVLANAVPRARLCDLISQGESVVSVRPPSEPLYSGRGVSEIELDLGPYDVPPVADGGGFRIQLRGLLYAPEKEVQGRMPLVVIAHGWHLGVDPEGQPVDSFRGYGYLARHLVRWGMIVFSVDLQPVNDLNLSDPGAGPQQFARAEIILRTILALRGHSLLRDVVNPDRVGIIGHSMGGEAVALAHHLNVTESRGAGVVAVVSIAPTRWHPEVVLPAGRYMQLFGSWDQLTGFIPSNDDPSAAGGMRIYDRGERDKTLFWIHGLRHNPFNTLWVPAGDFGEAGIADLALPAAEHERAAKTLITAFFQVPLFGRDYYRGYMEGTVLPQAVRHLEVHTSYSREPRDVLDNFGDDDVQAGIAAENPLDKTRNTRVQAAQAAGADIAAWEDVQHSAVQNSPHATAGVRLSWSGPTAEYTSQTGGLARAPEDVLSLRVAQFFEDPARNLPGLPADLFVAVSDGTEEAVVRLGAVAQIPHPDAAPKVWSMMRTVRLPMDAFLAANQALNLADVRMVTMRFAARATGHILGDDFELGP